MAKYGMFTCHDVLQRIGQVRYAEDLIAYWQRNVEDQLYTWYLAIAFVISEKRDTLEKLEKYKKDFKQSKAYLAYLKKNPNHIQEV
jgi:hypothetical protein